MTYNVILYLKLLQHHLDNKISKNLKLSIVHIYIYILSFNFLANTRATMYNSFRLIIKTTLTTKFMFPDNLNLLLSEYFHMIDHL